MGPQLPAGDATASRDSSTAILRFFRERFHGCPGTFPQTATQHCSRGYHGYSFHGYLAARRAVATAPRERSHGTFPRHCWRHSTATRARLHGYLETFPG